MTRPGRAAGAITGISAAGRRRGAEGGKPAMIPLGTSTFVQVMLAATILVPVIILWVVAVSDALRHGHTGLKLAAILVLILIVPILGPVLYLIFNRPEPVSAEQKYMADADLQRERHDRPVGTGMYR